MLRFLILFFSVISLTSYGQVNIGVFGGMNYSKISLKEVSTTISNPVQFIPSGPRPRSHRQSMIYYRNSFYGGIKFDIQIANSLLFSPKLIIENTGFQENFIQHFQSAYGAISSSSGGRKISDSIGGKDIVRLTYLSMPLHLVFLAPLGKARLSIGVGGFISCGLTGASDFQADFSTFPAITDSVRPVIFSKDDKYTSTFFHANRWDYGLSVTTGIQFRNGIFLEAMIENGFQSIFTDRFTVYDSGNNAIFTMPNKRRIIMFGIGYRFKRKL